MDAKTALFGVVAVALGVSVGANACQRRRHAAEIVDLQNKLAERDKTIEVAQGLYKKAAVDAERLTSLLDTRDEQVKALEQQLKKAREQLVGAVSEVVKWKQAYEGAAQASQTSSQEAGHQRLRVDFKKEWGFISAEGYTLTDPPFAYVKVQQTRPLKLTVALARTADGRYYAYSTSSEDGVQVDISSAGIDSAAFREKWYQKLALTTAFSVGDGLMGGAVGLTYRFGKFDLGPSVGMVVDSENRLTRVYGLLVGWRPFGQN